MEPLLIGETSRHREAITDLAVELAQKSAGFRRSLPESALAALAELVRAMNCYYSNLIEGHDTHPIEIERALADDYRGDARKRNLQIEAKAHILVQAWIDGGALSGRRATSMEGICEIHRRFCELLPEDLLWVEDAAKTTKVRVIPGQLRTSYVEVGRHVPISRGRCRDFSSASMRSMAALARQSTSSPLRPRITGYFGYTHFSMGTAAWPGSCRTRC